MTLLDTTERLRSDRALIEALIEDPSRLGPDFQPLRTLVGDTLVGYKATGRGQAGTELASTLALLASAQSTGLMERLDWAFRCRAFDQALDAGLTTELHLTPEVETYGRACPPRLATSWGRGRRGLTVVAEVYDEAFAPGVDLQRARDEWSEWGWRSVVVDVAHVLAADPSLLGQLEVLRPHAVLFDLSLPSRRRDPQGDRELMTLVRWAGEHGVEVHVSGVETELQRQQALALGAVVGRGRLFGDPAPLPL